MRSIASNVIATVMTLAVAILTANWATALAFNERGYEAIGGEFLIIPIVAYLEWKALSIFFNEVEKFANKKLGGTQ